MSDLLQVVTNAKETRPKTGLIAKGGDFNHACSVPGLTDQCACYRKNDDVSMQCW